MKSRRLRVVVLGAGVLGAAGLVLLLLLPHPGAGITPENYERIEKGMTEAEVEAVLGCPARNYSGKNAEKLEIMLALFQGWNGPIVLAKDEPSPAVPRFWVGHDLAILVLFRDGKVDSRFHEVIADQAVPWRERLRRLLRL